MYGLPEQTPKSRFSFKSTTSNLSSFATLYGNNVCSTDEVNHNPGVAGKPSQNVPRADVRRDGTWGKTPQAGRGQRATGDYVSAINPQQLKGHTAVMPGKNASSSCPDKMVEFNFSVRNAESNVRHTPGMHPPVVQGSATARNQPHQMTTQMQNDRANSSYKHGCMGDLMGVSESYSEKHPQPEEKGAHGYAMHCLSHVQANDTRDPEHINSARGGMTRDDNCKRVAEDLDQEYAFGRVANSTVPQNRYFSNDKGLGVDALDQDAEWEFDESMLEDVNKTDWDELHYDHKTQQAVQVKGITPTTWSNKQPQNPKDTDEHCYGKLSPVKNQVENTKPTPVHRSNPQAYSENLLVPVPFVGRAVGTKIASAKSQSYPHTKNSMDTKISSASSCSDHVFGKFRSQFDLNETPSSKLYEEGRRQRPIQIQRGVTYTESPNESHYPIGISSENIGNGDVPKLPQFQQSALEFDKSAYPCSSDERNTSAVQNESRTHMVEYPTPKQLMPNRDVNASEKSPHVVPKVQPREPENFMTVEEFKRPTLEDLFPQTPKLAKCLTLPYTRQCSSEITRQTREKPRVVPKKIFLNADHRSWMDGAANLGKFDQQKRFPPKIGEESVVPSRPLTHPRYVVKLMMTN